MYWIEGSIILVARTRVSLKKHLHLIKKNYLHMLLEEDKESKKYDDVSGNKRVTKLEHKRKEVDQGGRGETERQRDRDRERERERENSLEKNSG